jgi:peroxiredoxin
VVLSVDIGDEPAQVSAFAEEHDLTFPILLDQDGAVARTYRMSRIPASLFIDREGVIRKRHIGPLEESLVSSYLESIL